MSNKVVGIVLGLVLLVGGGVIILQGQKSPNNPTTSQKTETGKSSFGEPSSSQTKPNEVTIENFAFTPVTMKIKKGTTITWTNQDPAKHDVTSDIDSPQKGLGSQLLAKGESFSFTFDAVGTYKYHCSPHPYMKAMIEVTE